MGQGGTERNSVEIGMDSGACHGQGGGINCNTLPILCSPSGSQSAFLGPLVLTSAKSRVQVYVELFRQWRFTAGHEIKYSLAWRRPPELPSSQPTG